MQVYIEYVVIDNLVVNYILLNTTLNLCNYRSSKINILFSSIIGTIFVIFMPLLITNQILMLIYRIFTGATMILALKKFNNVKQYFAIFFVFLLLTLLFGGMLIASLSIFDIVYTSSGLLFLSFELPLSIFIIPIYLYSKLVIVVVRYIYSKIKLRKLMYDISIFSNGKTYVLKAFLDTGNSLFDMDGKPIVVMDFKTFCKIYPNIPLYKLITYSKQINELRNAHYIEVETVNSSNKMLVFEIDCLNISGEGGGYVLKNVRIGVSKKNFVDYNIILHRNLC